MRTRLLALPLGLLLLTGCASSPQAEVREDVRSVLAAANDEDADAVLGAVEDLLATLREQVGSGELTDAQAAPVRDAALAIRDSVAALDEPEQTPAPAPTPVQPEPEEPSPTPTPTPSPEPSEEPEETEPPVTEAPVTEAPVTEAPEPTQPPEDDGEEDDGDDGDGNQATVVPQLPVLTQPPSPTPTA